MIWNAFVGDGLQRKHHQCSIVSTCYLRITCRWVLLLFLATARNVLTVTEQPRSSLMTLYAYFRYYAMVIRPFPWFKTSLSWAYSFCKAIGTKQIQFVDAHVQL